ncbi:hypothetical protein K458DRAFT_393049 [Lentithecium fluviatile CBS 122367]|uniref:Killer toxin Kp4 domain-containing protein n=1 Tax=Lentithecium fluviatile CBS 122367 TaxID=1168545 RepID=A0A6G1IQ79_9PLEO|nr:hypothetical protein K458DRAFT_393049 [Lentithecium fluviatile CBS 122367]
MLAKILTFALLWVVALAVPSDYGHSPNLAGIANRDVITALKRGINCKGSSLCHGCDHLSKLRELVDTIPDEIGIKDGQLIACSDCYAFWAKCSGICVFLQYMGDKTMTAGEIKGLLGKLADNGCKGCGSASVYENEENLKKGELTVNFVRNGCCGSQVCHKNSTGALFMVNPEEEEEEEECDVDYSVLEEE